ncbi:hypothetical protein KSP40_PGU016542 [Platanthera guangdongensis]|uniref:Uncharacterized protein n=1 Tax=Platanthera guangdongensis TaxID=2320717 RepID=A0ABR2LI40_9ASPA
MGSGQSTSDGFGRDFGKAMRFWAEKEKNGCTGKNKGRAAFIMGWTVGVFHF